MDNWTLMQRIQQGDREAFATLYTEYNQVVYTMAMAKTGNHSQSLEIVKEVFREVYKTILENGPYSGEIYGWLDALTAKQVSKRQPPLPADQPQRQLQQPGNQPQQQSQKSKSQTQSRQVHGGAAEAAAAPLRQKPRKRWYKWVWVWLLIVLIGIPALSGVIGLRTKSDSPTSPMPTTSAAKGSSVETVTDIPAPTPFANMEPPVPEVSKEEYILGAKSIAYEDLVREPDKYIGETLTISVEISQIMQGGLLTEAAYRGYEDRFSKEWYICYDLPEGEPRLLQDDIVTFYGEYNGLRSLTRALTSTKDQVPELTARYHQPANENALSGNISDPSFGDTITFDNFEIVFEEDIVWSQVGNQYSDSYGAEVFSVPITVKNIGAETGGLNTFYYSQYGSSGNKLKDVGYYFDDAIDSAGDMRSGAQQAARMYFLYDGDGDYYVEFDNFSKKVEIRLPIKK